MKIEYEIKFSNRKTLNISVERDRTVVVRAPNHLSSEKIGELVDLKKDWLKEKLNHVQKYPSVPTPKEFISGESLMYLGKNYQLLVVDEDIQGVEFSQHFKIAKSNQEQINQLFKEWYKEQAKTKIVPIVDRYAKNLGVNYNQCKISEMKYRWGSCTPANNIHFNWRIIKSPLYVVNYIVVHELAHLIENNHSPEFWNIVSIQSPNFQKAKTWLKNYGQLLEIDF